MSRGGREGEAEINPEGSEDCGFVREEGERREKEEEGWKNCSDDLIRLLGEQSGWLHDSQSAENGCSALMRAQRAKEPKSQGRVSAIGGSMEG